MSRRKMGGGRGGGGVVFVHCGEMQMIQAQKPKCLDLEGSAYDIETSQVSQRSTLVTF